MSQSLDEELGDVGSEDNVLKATMLFKAIMDLTYQGVLKSQRQSSDQRTSNKYDANHSSSEQEHLFFNRSQ
ncbi:hypothetical protein CEXT_421711 [Caerostris extrusa]|uniref:Uncharacterized protein n=1 Tax=Caerostris extrusa TaxID=172846 RepID=A0AAV4WWT9_CAEEX|nr:hypothetical protein CEXT_421711 [Caerostris extrusa]